jgi:hypothetical protein
VSEPDLLTLFVDPLNALGVRYAVTGAVAAIVYGEPRLTTDIDIVLALEQREVARFSSAFDATVFYVPPQEALATEVARSSHGHFNIIHNPTFMRADIYLAGSDPLQAWALMAARETMVAGRPIRVAPPEYVITRKLIYRKAGGSDKHLHDIRAILRESRDAIDDAILQRRIDEHSLRTQWNEVLSQDETF